METSPSKANPTHVVSMHVEGVQRIHFAEYAPKSLVTCSGGKNEQGKSSFLDAIEYALRGPKSFSSMPVNNQHKEGLVCLGLGELGKGVWGTVTRTIKPDGRHELVVKEEGSEVPIRSPQKFLDSILSGLTFDPLNFIRMDNAKQVEVLKGLVPFNFSALKTQREEAYAKRTVVNQRLRDKEGENATRPYDPSLVMERLSEDELLQRVETEKQRAAAISTFEANMARGKAKIEELIGEISKLEALISAHRAKIQEIETYCEQKAPELQALKATASSGDIMMELRRIQEHNSKIDANMLAKEIFDQKIALQKESENLSLVIAECDRTRDAAIENAKLPVEGLTFTDEGVFFKGIPFEQCSQAVRVKVSTAMGIALNPQLKFICIRDGAFLDEDNLAIVKGMAEHYNMQMIIERVGTGDEVTLVFEDGKIKENRDDRSNDPVGGGQGGVGGTNPSPN